MYELEIELVPRFTVLFFPVIPLWKDLGLAARAAYRFISLEGVYRQPQDKQKRARREKKNSIAKEGLKTSGVSSPDPQMAVGNTTLLARSRNRQGLVVDGA